MRAYLKKLFGKKDLTAEFAKFAGKEVDCSPGAMVKDPVLAEIQKLAADNGYLLRIRLPGSTKTPDPRCFNVNLEKNADGKSYIKGFDIG